MIAVDTNLLVYAHRPEFPLHQRARTAIRGLTEGQRPWAIPQHCLVEFAGVVTHPRRFVQPSSPAQVATQVQAWRAAPGLVLLGDDASSLERFLGLLASGEVQGAMVHDARIAAVCLAGGVSELWTCDRDYGRFPALQTRNPLVG